MLLKKEKKNLDLNLTQVSGNRLSINWPQLF